MRTRVLFCLLMGVCLSGLACAEQKRIDVQKPAAEQPTKIAILANIWSAKCHANVIATKFFTGFPIDRGLVRPKVQVASIYIAQPRPDDVGHKLAEISGIKVYPTITEALTLGGKALAVDGVLYVGQHGKYQPSRFGQRMYPHLNHLEEVLRVFDQSKRSVPVFNDKEIAYSWLDAKWIYDRARELDAPFMAGSVLPVTYRKPLVVHPIGAEITEVVSVGYGNMTSYAFHALEILQCMVERRTGGETGVASVQALKGPAVYEAAQAGKFDMELAEAACRYARKRRGKTMPEAETGPDRPTAILINYKDGTKGTVIMATRYVGEYWGYAAKVGGETVACEFVAPPGPIYSYFSYMGLNVEKMFLTGRPQAPAERTLLTTGILDVAVRSLAAGGKVVPTPFLQIEYQPFDFEPIWPRSTAPKGASIGPWPPEGFEFIVPKRKRRPRRKAEVK